MKNSFIIKDLEIPGRFILAPMAGVSNPTYIKICEELSLGCAVTELISAESLVRGNKKTIEMLKGIEKISIPVGVQIFGSNASSLSKAAQIITEQFPKVFIDINMGCPVPKVALRAESGSALLKNPQKVGEIVESIVSSVNVPVTVKIRSGWDEEHINACEIAKICEEKGASAIAVHARTRAQGYTGYANWDIIKEVKESVSIPVIGNGDVDSPEKAMKMLEETGCDAVMIGRAAIGNPWIFKECKEYIEKKKIISKPTYEEKIEMIKYHYQLLKEEKNEKVALLEIRFHALAYLKGMPEAKHYKELICSSKTEEDFLNILEEYKNDLKNHR